MIMAMLSSVLKLQEDIYRKQSAPCCVIYLVIFSQAVSVAEGELLCNTAETNSALLRWSNNDVWQNASIITL